MSKKEKVPHEKFAEFQNKYGIIPAGDKNNIHLIKSRMLQGIYRNQKIENTYCNEFFGNNGFGDGGFVNFMRNKRLMKDAKNEFGEIKKRDRLTSVKRLLTNLLSSQPMAFNLFLPMKWDNFRLGNAVFKELFPFLNIKELVEIKMEYVPNDEKERITIDNSCFDVFVRYENNNNEIGGIGIEVKYTESFSQSNYWDIDKIRVKDQKNLSAEKILEEQTRKKKRYTDGIEKYSEQFAMEKSKEYLQARHNQLFRNQLIAERVKSETAIKNCILAVVHSEKDEKCKEIVAEFRKLIKLENSCVAVSIEQIVQSAIKASADFPETKSLYENIYNRYCDYGFVERFF